MSNLALRLGLAYEAVKQSLSPTKAAPMPVGNSTSSTSDPEHFIEFAGNSVFFDCYDNPRKQAQAFKECPPLSYILNQKALMLTNGRISCENGETGKEKKGDIGREWMQLINFPNPLQTGTQFLAQVSTYLTLFGFCPVLKVVPVGFEEVKQLWVLPPHMMTIKVNQNYLYCSEIQDMIDEVTFTYRGRKVVIDKDQLYFFTDRTCSIDNLMFPLSRLRAMMYPINNLTKNYESRAVLIEKRGALGILSPDSSDTAGPQHATPQMKQQLQQDYKKYGLLKDQWQIIISTIAMKFTPMALNMRDLMLLETAEDDIMSLCDALGFKFQLLSRGSKTTFNNQNIAEKAQYQDYTIPEADNLISQFNDCVNAVDHKIKFVIDYSHVACLQTDKKEESETRRNNVSSIVLQFKNNLITFGRAMEILGEVDSVPTELDKLFFYQLPEEIRTTFATGPADNNSQNENSNEQAK